jgi:Glycosyl transferase family 2
VKAKVTSIWGTNSHTSGFPKPTSAPLNDTEEYVAMCIAVKDQHKDLPEFLIHHYYHMGIRRFYLMDDGSEPPLSTIAEYGIPSTAITHKYYTPDHQNQVMQAAIYNECISQWRQNHTWFAFVDSDEFYDTPGKETLKEILQSFEGDESVGALAVNWRTHTSAGLLKRPQSVRKSFTTCITDLYSPSGVESDNMHIKSIVKSAYYIDPQSPHSFNLKDGAKLVGEDGQQVHSAPRRAPITRKRIGLHHYAVKSKEEYQEKIDRSNANRTPKDWGWWDHIEKEMSHEPCTEMTLYEP